MLKRVHQARIPLHQLVQPPPPKCHYCSTAPSLRDLKGKQREQPRPAVQRPIDWSKPSTSTIPYSPPTHPTPLTASQRVAQTQVGIPNSPSTDLDRVSLSELLDKPDVPISQLIRSFELELPTLARATFDRLFDRLSNSPSSSSSALRKIKVVIERKRRWSLDERQMRTILAASLEREKRYRVIALNHEHHDSNDDKGNSRTDSDERAIWAQRKRQNVSDALLKEYLVLVSNPKAVPKVHHRAVAEVLELYAICAAIRPDSTTRDHDGQALLAYSVALDYYTSSPSPESKVIENDIAEVIRRMFRTGRDEEAMQILGKIARKGRSLTVKVTRDIVMDYHEARYAIATKEDSNDVDDKALLARFDNQQIQTTAHVVDRAEPDEYTHARRVLDQVCTATSRDGLQLDDLLRLRLERVDRLEELQKDPRGAFLKWLGGGKRAHDCASLETALRLWEAGARAGDDAESVLKKQSYRKVLEILVLKACRTGAVRTTTRDGKDLPGSSPLIDYAVNLALAHFPLQVLIHHSHTLLSALTVDSHSPDLAATLFDRVNSPAPDFPFARFQWSAALLTTFTRLFFSYTRFGPDRALPLRLYLSWTASGLTFPMGLWDPLWRHLGRSGVIEDLERVLQDWEETGRGDANSRIVKQVLQGAISTGNVPQSLKVYEFLRSRYHSPQFDSRPTYKRTHLDPLVVPIDSYNALMDLVAHSRTDLRKTLSELYSHLVTDGHAPTIETYNAFLVANLMRSRFNLEDIDSAGVVYNKVVRSGLDPDRDTFGLLMHGFNRMAQSFRDPKGIEKTANMTDRRQVGIEASLRTFRASTNGSERSADNHEHRFSPGQDRTAIKTLARGRFVGDLMKLLAEEHRFEDAKQVGEEWWRIMIAMEPAVGGKGFWEGDQIQAECEEMRNARESVERIEMKTLK
ncbi:uncharacterized protein JCM15063_001237 [Sporobolomyces koalae]|uniref:uncharacterized protein n=1 Tax=Sporobolomyces koalae TaxID=500713 RepID=UPI00316EEE68